MKKKHILALSLAIFCISCVYSMRKYILRMDSAEPQNQHALDTRLVKPDLQNKTRDGRQNDNTSGFKKISETKCNPKRNVFFMKTHKTGSTTMQNILLRYAWAQNLTVGLPLSSNNFDYANQKKFDRKMVQPLAVGTQINMLMHHMIFSRSGVSRVLAPDTVYFTILRDPATHFKSVFEYYKTNAVPFNKVKSLEEFITSPQKYFQSAARLTFSWFAKNGMTFDLGFDNLNEADANVQSIIREMDDTFDIVLITEYFDISLILLREKLCWTMQDIAYLSVNARRTSTAAHDVDQKISKKIRDWNKIDTKLYNYYNATFWTRVKKYGLNRLQNELKELSKLKHDLKSYCVEEGLFVNKEIYNPRYKLYNPPGVQMTQYHLKKLAEKNETCIQLILPEIPWWRKMTSRQKGRRV